MDVDAGEHVKQLATDLQDTVMLTRLATGDVVSEEASYHATCQRQYRNRHRSYMRKMKRDNDSQSEEHKIEARAFIELMNYIEASVEEEVYYFKFSELRHMYEQRLEMLGFEKEINKVRFKQQVLQYFPKAQEQSDGRHTILVFDKGMTIMMKRALDDYQGDAVILAKAAKIIREDIFDFDGFQFDGSFPPRCQETSVPTTLKMLVSMLLYGPVKCNNVEETQVPQTVNHLYPCTWD
eukprot:TRINITY_DN59427_c0_g1_i1.p2 TRINITY_DN59427_c0_g1~~TRINITY_DN59427_c0_g1_i1.p2  ORF type:complete len:251 (+),score=43.78 TRINITY_DN59427_c0_g1_i1:43-753(+)